MQKIEKFENRKIEKQKEKESKDQKTRADSYVRLDFKYWDYQIKKVLLDQYYSIKKVLLDQKDIIKQKK